MKRPTTIDKNKFKWPVCLTLALLIFLQAVPVMATEQQTEQTQTPTVTEVAGSESAESVASGENGEIVADELEPIDLQEVATTSNSDWTTTKPHEGEVLHGGYVGFKNKASGKYLTIQSGTAASGINVCQQSASSIANAQEFYLQYTYLVTGSLANFTIYPINSSGSVATNLRVKAGTISEGSANVSLGTSSFIQTNERWQIEHVVDNYYCIYIADNPTSASVKYALSAYNGSDSAAPTVGTLDDVYVAEYTGHESQLWQICADGKPSDINGFDMLSDNKNGTAYPGEKVSYYYIPKAFNETITWRNSSSDTISLDANGTATAIRTGSGYLQVTVSGGASNLLRSYSASCHVLLEDGFYYVKSYDENYLMDLEGGSTSANTPIQVCHTGGEVESNNQIFKFVHVGEGCYNILPLKTATKGLSWSAETTNVLNNNVSSGSMLQDTAKWKLRTCKYTVNGVVHYGVNIHASTETGKTITIPENYEDCTNLVTASYTATNTRQIWQICGDHVDIVSLWLFGDLVAGEHYDFPVYCVGAFEPMYTEWRLISGYDIVSLDSIHEIGKFTTLKPGVAQVEVRIYSSSAKETLLDSETYTLKVYPAPSEGDWFMENALSGQYASTNGQTTLGGSIVQMAFNDHATMEWEFEHVTQNYFRIISKANGLYLTAPSSIISPVMQESLINDYSLWKIEKTSGNRYKISSKAYETSNYVLASFSSTIGSLYLCGYSNDTNYNDEWYLNISGDELTILSVADHNMLRAEAATQAEANAEVYGVDCNLIISDHTSIQAALTGIATSEVFISRSHGSKVSIGIYSLYIDAYGNEKTESLLASDIYDYETNTAVVDLSNCELIVFIGCSTAACENGESITHAVVDAGASAAIGFTESIEYSLANTWMNTFIAKYYHATDRHLGRAFLMTKDEVFGESSGSAKLILNQSSQ